MPQRKWSLLALVVFAVSAGGVRHGGRPAAEVGHRRGQGQAHDHRGRQGGAARNRRPRLRPRFTPWKSWPAWPLPQGPEGPQETVVVFDAKPSRNPGNAVESLGLKPACDVPQNGGEKLPTGPEVNIFIEVPTESGETKRVPIEKVMIDSKTNKPLGKQKWHFTGSPMIQPD